MNNEEIWNYVCLNPPKPINRTTGGYVRLALNIQAEQHIKEKQEIFKELEEIINSKPSALHASYGALEMWKNKSS